MNILDAQLLLYVAPGQFESCTKFYEDVFEVTSFYGWDEAADDRGCKYHIGGMVLVVLAQEKPFDEPSAPANFQMEVADVEALYRHVEAVAPQSVTHELFTRPYGWRMFRITDPAGNRINLYQIPKD